MLDRHGVQQTRVSSTALETNAVSQTEFSLTRHDDTPAHKPNCPTGRALSVAGLFAGIGGIEHGLAQVGHACELLCEILPEAQAVLRARFPGVRLVCDVRELPSLPSVDLVT